MADQFGGKAMKKMLMESMFGPPPEEVAAFALGPSGHLANATLLDIKNSFVTELEKHTARLNARLRRDKYDTEAEKKDDEEDLARFTALVPIFTTIVNSTIKPVGRSILALRNHILCHPLPTACETKLSKMSESSETSQTALVFYKWRLRGLMQILKDFRSVIDEIPFNNPIHGVVECLNELKPVPTTGDARNYIVGMIKDVNGATSVVNEFISRLFTDPTQTNAEAILALPSIVFIRTSWMNRHTLARQSASKAWTRLSDLIKHTRANSTNDLSFVHAAIEDYKIVSSTTVAINEFLFPEVPHSDTFDVDLMQGQYAAMTAILQIATDVIGLTVESAEMWKTPEHGLEDPKITANTFIAEVERHISDDVGLLTTKQPVRVALRSLFSPQTTVFGHPIQTSNGHITITVAQIHPPNEIVQSLSMLAQAFRDSQATSPPANVFKDIIPDEGTWGRVVGHLEAIDAQVVVVTEVFGAKLQVFMEWHNGLMDNLASGYGQNPNCFADVDGFTVPTGDLFRGCDKLSRVAARALAAIAVQLGIVCGSTQVDIDDLTAATMGVVGDETSSFSVDNQKKELHVNLIAHLLQIDLEFAKCLKSFPSEVLESVIASGECWSKISSTRFQFLRDYLTSTAAAKLRWKNIIDDPNTMMKAPEAIVKQMILFILNTRLALMCQTVTSIMEMVRIDAPQTGTLECVRTIAGILCQPARASRDGEVEETDFSTFDYTAMTEYLTKRCATTKVLVKKRSINHEVGILGAWLLLDDEMMRPFEDSGSGPRTMTPDEKNTIASRIPAELCNHSKIPPSAALSVLERLIQKCSNEIGTADRIDHKAFPKSGTVDISPLLSQLWLTHGPNRKFKSNPPPVKTVFYTMTRPPRGSTRSPTVTQTKVDARFVTFFQIVCTSDNGDALSRFGMNNTLTAHHKDVFAQLKVYAHACIDVLVKLFDACLSINPDSTDSHDLHLLQLRSRTFDCLVGWLNVCHRRSFPAAKRAPEISPHFTKVIVEEDKIRGELGEKNEMNEMDGTGDPGELLAREWPTILFNSSDRAHTSMDEIIMETAGEVKDKTIRVSTMVTPILLLTDMDPIAHAPPFHLPAKAFCKATNEKTSDLHTPTAVGGFGIRSESERIDGEGPDDALVNAANAMIEAEKYEVALDVIPAEGEGDEGGDRDSDDDDDSEDESFAGGDDDDDDDDDDYAEEEEEEEEIQKKRKGAPAAAAVAAASPTVKLVGKGKGKRATSDSLPTSAATTMAAVSPPPTKKQFTKADMEAALAAREAALAAREAALEAKFAERFAALQKASAFTLPLPPPLPPAPAATTPQPKKKSRYD